MVWLFVFLIKYGVDEFIDLSMPRENAFEPRRVCWHTLQAAFPLIKSTMCLIIPHGCMNITKATAVENGLGCVSTDGQSEGSEEFFSKHFSEPLLDGCYIYIFVEA